MDIITLYDMLCAALTRYEEDDTSEGAEGAGKRLYNELCDIVNEVAEKIN